MTVGGPYPDDLLFRYTHPKGEPEITLVMAEKVAATVAEDAAIKTGLNHVVARSIRPRGFAVYPENHPRLREDKNLVPVLAVTPQSSWSRIGK